MINPLIQAIIFCVSIGDCMVTPLNGGDVLVNVSPSLAKDGYRSSGLMGIARAEAEVLVIEDEDSGERIIFTVGRLSNI